jgi:UDP-N-acetylglucosamine--N-acetylmuramyl-(pentapeptide) pyrophosphoryl-undecaprenol N-acetylglucosamine transferase
MESARNDCGLWIADWKTSPVRLKSILHLTIMTTLVQSAIHNPRIGMRVMIAGGGTGGHIYIGVALARELKRRDSSSDFLFVGTRRGLESRIVPQEGFRLEYIDSAGLKGVSVTKVVRSLLLVPRSIVQSGRLVRDYAPDVVVGVGGYSSGPVLLASWLRRKPTLIVEPNAYPGLTNRSLAMLVDRAVLALPDRGGHFRGKGVVTGIPVRPEFGSLPVREHRSGRLTLLVYGGSQGSHALNTIVCGALEELRKMGSALRIIHQTGERELEPVQRAYREAQIEADVRAFLPRIHEEFAAADLLLSRAGAGTIAEITVAGKAAILVPFPAATDDHQTRNARALEELGAARMIPEPELTPDRLAAEVRGFLNHPERLTQIEAAARKLGKPDATQRIADLVMELARK